MKYKGKEELTMHVREFSPMKESRSTWVSLLALKGVCGLLRPRALIHSCFEGNMTVDREKRDWVLL